MYVHVFTVFVLSCVGRSILMGQSSVQQVYQMSTNKIRKRGIQERHPRDI